MPAPCCDCWVLEQDPQLLEPKQPVSCFENDMPAKLIIATTTTKTKKISMPSKCLTSISTSVFIHDVCYLLCWEAEEEAHWASFMWSLNFVLWAKLQTLV